MPSGVRGGLCEKIDSVCPPLEQLYKWIEEKASIARQVYSDDRRVYSKPLKIPTLFSHALRVWGKIQTLDLREPPPSDYRVLLYTMPGILSCIYSRYYCRGYLYNEFMSLQGGGGYGKSTIAILLANILGGVVYTEEDNVLLGLMNLISRGEWVPILILDDISAIISKYWYMERKERPWKNLFKMLEYAKDVAGVVLITSRNFGGEARRLRDLSTYIGTIRRVVVGGKILDVIEWRTKGSTNTPPEYVDVLFPGLKMPESEWNRLMKTRRLKSQILVMETLIGLAEEGEIAVDKANIDFLKARLEELKKQYASVQL